jgi:GMP synthase (glutamine-hydrolysing)
MQLRRLLLYRDTIDLLRQVNAAVEEVVSGIDDIWQIPVVSLPLYDRGGRQVFVVRPVCSTDAMTADVYEMSTLHLDEIVHRVARIPKAGPLLYDVTTKPPATIEWE